MRSINEIIVNREEKNKLKKNFKKPFFRDRAKKAIMQKILLYKL
jgi:hypothetical protein